MDAAPAWRRYLDAGKRATHHARQQGAHLSGTLDPGAKGGPVKSGMNVFQITDPELHTWFNCEVRTKFCELLQYTLTTEQAYLPALGPTRTQPHEIGHRTQEDLGPGNTVGV